MTAPQPVLTVLKTQLRMLVTVLALDDTNIAADIMLAELAQQVADTEALLSRIAGAALREIRSGLAHAGDSRRDDARAAFLMAAQCLARSSDSDGRHPQRRPRLAGNDVAHRDRIQAREEGLLRIAERGA